uniref:DNA-3-methyladenine glycosylase n=1 Tax=Bos indicus x Bos taurus TaxID=30522 RepID=A0A4W2C4N2_BOBOX
MERGACAPGAGPAEGGGRVTQGSGMRAARPARATSSGRTAGTTLAGGRKRFGRGRRTWWPSWTKSDGQPHPLPDPDFPAQWGRKSSERWRPSGIRTHQTGPRRLPPRSCTWGRPRPWAPRAASISQARRAVLLAWDQRFSTSPQCPWPGHFSDRRRTFLRPSQWMSSVEPLPGLGCALILGQILVRRLDDGTELRGRIVETEAYLGPEDEAAHSRGGRQTPRNRGMFMKPGTLYVYLIYGMYFCMNVSSRGDGACVLLRALEPLGGLEAMRQLRHALRKGAAGRALKDRELCNGPSKLCQALAIDRSFDQRDLARDESVWLEQGPPEPSEPAVVAAARVGIGQAGEWVQKPLRFYIRGSPWVSVVDRAAERDTQTGARACSHKDF